MKRIIALAFCLVLAACAGTGTVNNPLTNNDVYRVKLAYDTTLKLANTYRSECFKRTYAQILADPIWAPVCKNRRTVVRQMQVYQPKARMAVNAVTNFVNNNPTLSYTALLGEAWNAVTLFQNVVPRLPVI